MKDRFSGHAASYAANRPHYPAAMFRFIQGLAGEHELAWDCGTGNGQSAAALAPYFKRVHATDISEAQLKHAPNIPNITYAVEPAEASSLPAASVDLVTVSQALHWFHFDEFYRELKRGSKPAGIFAAWMYSLVQVGPAIDELVSTYHFETLDGFWDPERAHVDSNYETIPFPFEKIDCPPFQIELDWSLQAFEGYLQTWSALQKYIAVKGESPLPALLEAVGAYWPANENRTVRFPIHLRVGRVHG